MIEVKKSSIHRHGVFATRDIKRNVKIPLIDKKVPGYRKFRGYNRSCYPNAVLYNDEFGNVMYVVRDIPSGEEITLGYPIRNCNCGECQK